MFLMSCCSSLQLVSEWRPVVEKLLLLSYRLSTVVSPVIQSSSPEGLIPMDTDSGQQTRKATVLSFDYSFTLSFSPNLFFGQL
jgi:hypothetical protein